RILARVGGADTAIRLMTPQGLPLDGTTSDDPTPPYNLVAPEILADPNPLAPFLEAVGVPSQKGTPAPAASVDTEVPIARYIAAYIAHVEGQGDVASVLSAPLTDDRAKATGPALSVLAAFVEHDPIYPSGDARDLVKEIRTRAAEKDAE